ncbi:DNA repair protein RadA [candidate division GN15 bacterium]|uniref:DNA repair protein RadA n=1 Tax=candidate division GN15 bacterium TaxID=2072418 RepID=A0A855XCM3_9BACT|nr:MAG: DNA repair protein RadA [candidate division GN15 bacterium]
MIPGKKIKTAYFCSQCGAQHPRWQGQCKECGAWNSLIEERVPDKRKAGMKGSSAETRTIAQIEGEILTGWRSGVVEFDRVIGGSLLPGQTVLLGGDPGIGKSTLMLQAAEAYSRQKLPVLYVTGEESMSQIKLRSNRLKVMGENVTVVTITTLEEIVDLVRATDYAVVLIDSIQTIVSSQFDSPPGTVAQIRECANTLIGEAKSKGFALFLVGHVTKEGLVAGPKVLEHMVDTVVYFEGDSSHLYRMLRAVKNRFGSVAEIGLFEMGSDGLSEVTNPSAFFLSGHSDQPRSGSVVSAIVEGNRPLLVEVQALVARGSYGNPQRVAGGIDNKKLALLLAILERRCDYPMSQHDVFVSVAGGLRVTEPALDLAVLTAITSSLVNRTVDHRLLAIGEVGLSGEVRGVTHIDRRVAEAVRLGFETILIPAANESQVQEKSARIVAISNLQLALDIALG